MNEASKSTNTTGQPQSLASASGSPSLPQTPEVKAFPLRVLLTVVTDRLLTQGKGPRDNGIGDLYDILGWMTNDSPFTHQLGRFMEECKPWLLKWFSEITPALASLASLDKWLKADKTGTGEEGIKMWLTELKMMFPEIKDSYDVPRIPAENHASKNPLEELVEMRGGKTDGIVVLATD